MKIKVAREVRPGSGSPWSQGACCLCVLCARGRTLRASLLFRAEGVLGLMDSGGTSRRFNSQLKQEKSGGEPMKVEWYFTSRT